MRQRARGFSLVSAIFLMVVLVVLGVSMVTISSVQQTTVAQLLQVARANAAARAGVEWAIAKADSTWCAAPTTTTFPLPAPMDGFTVTVECERSDHTIGTAPMQYFVVDVTATSGTYGTPDFVRRRLQAKVVGA